MADEMEASTHARLSHPTGSRLYCPQQHVSFVRPDHVLRLYLQLVIGPRFLRFDLVRGVSGVTLEFWGCVTKQLA